jgi:LHFPL tetraspan subfamily member protein
MSTSLSVTGVFWAIFSFVAAAVTSVGYFMPYWLIGPIPPHSDSSGLQVSFGTFRRCGYLETVSRLAPGSVVATLDYGLKVVNECGRYTTFQDIPSIWWQITTVIIGVGCCTSLLVAFAAIACCCVKDAMTQIVARVAMAVQVFAGE